MTEYSDLMEGAPVTKIGEIVAKLANADPQRVAKIPTRVFAFADADADVAVKVSA